MDPDSCFATHFMYMSHDYCHGADDHMIIEIHYGGIIRFLLVFFVYFGQYLQFEQDVSMKLVIIL